MDEKIRISLFKSIFRGREDVFAIRWEKGGKNGYMPAYFFDPYRLKLHKIKGGTFQNFPDKSYLPFSEDQIARHLNGTHLAGVYPLLPDNTSWFIAADFDKDNWIEECRKFLKVCGDNNIPAYLERSRSGKGGHVWVFFEKPYPASKSRKIVLSLLMQSGSISTFDKNSSFDRLFPNQDYLTKKKLGNLIALPLYKPTWEQGNSCFIDPETLKPFENQWQFLSEIQRLSSKKLDELFQSLLPSSTPAPSPTKTHNSSELSITLDNAIRLNRHAMSSQLISFLKEELNFTNTEFIIKKKTGKNTFGTERYFNFIEETDNEIILPKGFAGKLLRFCMANHISYTFHDARRKHQPIDFQFNAVLRPHQETAMEMCGKKDMGVIVAPPGSGKTVVGLKIVAEKQQPTLIVVHRKQLLEQWAERVQTFLNIPIHEIGKIGQGKAKTGKHVTIAMIQSLAKELAKPDCKLTDAFGTIIIDECHHIPAASYRNAIAKLNSYYLYGLTATPFRKYDDGKLIFIHLGEVIADIKPQEISAAQQAKVVVRNTQLDVPFNPKTDRFETLSKILVHDSARNKLILHDVVAELNAGKKAIIITERKEHIDSLYQYLKQSFEVVTLSGDDSATNRAAKWQTLNDGNYQALITTGQFFGEGTDLQNANCLFLVYPFSFEGKLIQYIGRVQRSEITPTIYDYRDISIDYLNRLFLKRNIYYRKLERQASLFDDLEKPSKPRHSTIIDKEILVPIEVLDFRYGMIAFRHRIQETGVELEFELENDEIRPEFEVLKPYFAKVLQSKTINVHIQAEFENNTLVSQLAESQDIGKINKELIGSVRFRFVTKHLLGKYVPTKSDSDNSQQMQTDHALYASGEELLNDILKHSKFKHRQHLRYLADRHAAHLLKIRFVLNPFSFVFLLAGDEQFHIVLETLDTEEATYLWHFDRYIPALPANLKEIDRQLNIIRNQGRQVFLEMQPDNFSRVQHDYSEERKGFVVWKSMLEERLV